MIFTGNQSEIMLSYMISAQAMQETQSNGTMTGKDQSEFLFQQLREEPVLCRQNICTAIGGNDQITVWSGPAPDKAFDSVIAVYNDLGEYLYGYEIQETAKNGIRAIAFINNELVLYSGWYGKLYTIDAGGDGITHTKRITTQQADALFKPQGAVWSSISIECVDPDASCRLVDCSNGKLIIRNARGDIITIYDHHEYYEPRFQFPSPFGIFAAWGTFGIIAISTLIACRKKRLKQEHRNKFLCSK